MSDNANSDPLPYTQVDRAVKPKAALLAGAVGISPQHAMGSLVEFWDLCGDPRELERLVSEGKHEVVLTSPEVIVRFKLASGVLIDPSLLVSLGLLEHRGDFFRVRGMSRYFQPIEKRVRLREAARAGGVSRSGAARLNGKFTKGGGADAGAAAGRPLVDESALIQPLTSQPPAINQPAGQPSASDEPPQRSAVSGQRSAASLKSTTGPRFPKPPKPEETTDPRHAPMVLALVDVYREETLGAKYFFEKRDAANVRELLAKSADDEEILYRWRVALKASSNPYQSPKTRNLSDFVRDWNAYPVSKQANPNREMRL